MTLVRDKVPLGHSHYDTCYGQCALGQSHYDTCYAQCATRTVIMTLVMDNVPLGQSHYVTCYGQCAPGTESLCHLLWTTGLWESHYDTC